MGICNYNNCQMLDMKIRGGQKNKNANFNLACKLPPSTTVHWFQKVQNQVWGTLGKGHSKLKDSDIHIEPAQ